MKLTENIYRLDASRSSGVYLIKGEETILIDTGLAFAGKGILKEIQGICPDLTEIKQILLTHHDYDHIGNVFALSELTGAAVWASAEDIPYIYGEKDRSSFKKYFKYLFKVPVPAGIQPYVPGELVCGIEVIPTPGHTPGHVSLRYGDYLFAGDLFENKNGRLFPYPKAWNWDNRVMAESVKLAEALPVKWICPAHGLPVSK